MIRDNNTKSSLYRSKTPTADLYSTEPKTVVIPARSKTPLIDFRSHIMSPSNDLNISELEASLNFDLNKKNKFKELKSYDFLDQETMTNNNTASINVISNLANQFYRLEMDNHIYDNKSDSSKITKNYLNAPSGSNGLDFTENIYSSTFNNCAPCNCYDCQDYTGRQHDNLQSNCIAVPPHINENVGIKMNQIMNDRRHNIQDEQNNINVPREWPPKFGQHHVSLFTIK